MRYLKRAAGMQQPNLDKVTATVTDMLRTIERDREDAVLRYARQLDGWHGEVLFAAQGAVSEQEAADLAVAHERIARFARAQRGTQTELEVELYPGFVAGHKLVPVDVAGFFVARPLL